MKTLLLLDRDGTLIEAVDYLGKEEDWEEKIVLRKDVLGKVKHIQKNNDVTTLIVSNQSGVAWGFFDEQRVMEINNMVIKMLKIEGIKIDGCGCAFSVDCNYALEKGIEKFQREYVTPVSFRKPSPTLVYEGLKKLKKRIGEFERIIVIGDRPEDEGLAKNLGADYINVGGEK